jgi:hypothetical protein
MKYGTGSGFDSTTLIIQKWLTSNVENFASIFYFQCRLRRWHWFQIPTTGTTKACLPAYHTGLLLGSFFYYEDGGDMFFRNIG